MFTFFLFNQIVIQKGVNISNQTFGTIAKRKQSQFQNDVQLFKSSLNPSTILHIYSVFLLEALKRHLR
jgi:hypothetical protein